jgi:hypothetical protein
MPELTPVHFHDERIEPIFKIPPIREKTPHCPDGFLWNGKTYFVTKIIAEWSDFTRRGKMEHNMRPEHAAPASVKGSLNVGRFYFRVKVDSNQIFDIYYDRAIKSVDKRKGEWILYRELR